MQKISTITTTTYDYDGIHFVDVVHNRDECVKEAWLYRKDNGIKKMMFGVPDHIPVSLDDISEYIEEYDETVC